MWVMDFWLETGAAHGWSFLVLVVGGKRSPLFTCLAEYEGGHLYESSLGQRISKGCWRNEVRTLEQDGLSLSILFCSLILFPSPASILRSIRLLIVKHSLLNYTSRGTPCIMQSPLWCVWVIASLCVDRFTNHSRIRPRNPTGILQHR